MHEYTNITIIFIIYLGLSSIRNVAFPSKVSNFVSIFVSLQIKRVIIIKCHLASAKVTIEKGQHILLLITNMNILETNYKYGRKEKPIKKIECQVEGKEKEHKDSFIYYTIVC